jgi:hypothetical protein
MDHICRYVRNSHIKSAEVLGRLLVADDEMAAEMITQADLPTSRSCALLKLRDLLRLMNVLLR